MPFPKLNPNDLTASQYVKAGLTGLLTRGLSRKASNRMRRAVRRTMVRCRAARRQERDELRIAEQFAALTDPPTPEEVAADAEEQAILDDLYACLDEIEERGLAFDRDLERGFDFDVQVPAPRHLDAACCYYDDYQGDIEVALFESAA